MDDLDEGRSKLRKLAVGARIGIALVVLSGVNELLANLWPPFAFSPANYLGAGVGDGLFLSDILVLASAIPVGMWIYRAHANLQAADLPGLEYTAGWSVGWFFIPIASLWKPFSAMRELWNASHGAIGDYSANAPGLLWIWWLSWLFRGFAGFGTIDPTLAIIGNAALIVCAASLWMIVDAVTRRQESFGIGQVFA